MYIMRGIKFFKLDEKDNNRIFSSWLCSKMQIEIIHRWFMLQFKLQKNVDEIQIKIFIGIFFIWK